MGNILLINITKAIFRKILEGGVWITIQLKSLHELLREFKIHSKFIFKSIKVADGDLKK